MSSFIERAAQNTRVQLATTAVVSGAAVAASILAYQRLQKEDRLFELKQLASDAANGVASSSAQPTASTATADPRLPPPDKEDVQNAALARRAQAGDFDDELVQEQLARNRAFLTDAGLARLRDAFVVVVGCGGVGSHCAAALARSGVSRLRLVDFDQVTLSSLNRHAVATLADVGTPKVRCLRRRLVAVAPWVRFDLRLEKFDEASASALLAGWEEGGQAGQAGQEGQEWRRRRPDFIVDAIDNIDTKVALLRLCYEQKLPVISSMGAGCKSDPTRIVVGDIGASTDDGLSRATRRRLKLQGITGGIPVVFSTEKSGEGKAELLPLPDEEFEKGQVGELGVLPQFRVRILPVLGTMPAIFGLTVANHVILSITGYPTDYVPAKGREKLYEQLLTAIQAGEERIARVTAGGAPGFSIGLKIPVTAGDVAFLVEDIFRGRSAISGIPTRLTLIRWSKPQQSNVVTIGEPPNQQNSSNVRLGDLVCMTREEAIRHDKEFIKGDKQLEDLYDAATIERVESLMKQSAAYEQYR